VQVVQVDVQPPMEAPEPVLYLPDAQATHVPSFVQVFVFFVSSAAGQLHPLLYFPAAHDLLAHGVCECGWCV